MQQSTTQSVAQRIAREIADDLFKNGMGQEADRLVLTKDNDRTGHSRQPTTDLGGWCKQSVVDRAAAIITSRLPQQVSDEEAAFHRGVDAAKEAIRTEPL